MNCVVYPSTRDELDVVWNGQLRNKQLALGEVQIRGLTPLHRPLPEEINVSSWVSRKSWELSVPEELQYMLVTYKTIGYNNKIYQSCLLTATCHSKDSELMESFAQHLASERFGVGYAAIDYATHMVFIPRYRRIDANDCDDSACRAFFHVLVCFEPLTNVVVDDAMIDVLQDYEMPDDIQEYTATVPMQNETKCEKSLAQSDSMHEQEDTPSCRTNGAVLSSVFGTEDTGYSARSDMDISPLPQRDEEPHFYEAMKEEPVFLEEDRDEVLTDNCNDGDSLGEHVEPVEQEETPLLGCLRTVLAALEERRRSQDSESVIGRDNFQNGNENGDSFEYHDPYSACKQKETRHSWSSGLSCQSEFDDWDLLRGTVYGRHRLRHFRYGPGKSMAQLPPRGGLASYYKGTKWPIDYKMSRYMMNSCTRVWPNRSCYRNPKSVRM